MLFDILKKGNKKVTSPVKSVPELKRFSVNYLNNVSALFENREIGQRRERLAAAYCK